MAHNTTSAIRGNVDLIFSTRRKRNRPNLMKKCNEEEFFSIHRRQRRQTCVDEVTDPSLQWNNSQRAFIIASPKLHHTRMAHLLRVNKKIEKRVTDAQNNRRAKEVYSAPQVRA